MGVWGEQLIESEFTDSTTEFLKRTVDRLGLRPYLSIFLGWEIAREKRDTEILKGKSGPACFRPVQ